jgi:S-adenosylmethionine-dependent methyltransferase
MNLVAQTYDSDPEREWMRLVRDPFHTLEMLVTWRMLQKHLPASGVILDAGGGPGRYALELCRAGYQVVLFDLSSGELALAQQKFKSESEAVQSRLLECIQGDIRDLSWFDNCSFDAVLCLGGPLTHIPARSDRLQAMTELARVIKPGGLAAISVVGFLAVLRTILVAFSDELLEPPYQDLLGDGNSPGPAGMLWHFYRAAELKTEAEACGLSTLDMAGCEGLSSSLWDATNLLAQDEAKWKVWIDTILRTCTEPAVVDTSEHILWIGRKSSS